MMSSSFSDRAASPSDKFSKRSSAMMLGEHNSTPYLLECERFNNEELKET
jgi:hypothetical protein